MASRLRLPSCFVLALMLVLAAALLTPVGAQSIRERAFIFGSRQLDCPLPDDPGESYEVVFHGTAAELRYDPARGWGYEEIDPGAVDVAAFGPFDNSPNNRNSFGDSCPEEIYDSFIGAKNFATPCAGVASPDELCSPPEGIIFRINVPNGSYRFVAAVGSADNPHTSRLVAEDGGEGGPDNLGPRHVVLVHNHDQASEGAGVFARVGFDGHLPPEATGPGFVDMGEDGFPTAGAPTSPILEVTNGSIRIHQLKGATTGSDPNGGNLVVLELWRVNNTFRAIERGDTWSFRAGATAAPADWLDVDFDDAGWTEAGTPVGYGEGGVVTDLASSAPPMEDNYSSFFLRRRFELVDALAVNQLQALVNYDDGFALWVNGIEVLRQNVSGTEGDPISHEEIASASHESGTYELFDLPNPRDYLVTGTNIVAAQVVNRSLGSSDAFFDLELFDPIAPDLSPPEIASVTPRSGTTVRRLDEVRVRFTEGVSGVDAGDLLVDGQAAASVSGDGAGPWIFSFPARAAGAVSLRFRDAHGIVDQSDQAHPFAGASFDYVVDPTLPLGSLVLNEILALNGTGLRDEDGDESDWVEIRNDGATTVDLAGWSLSDDPDEPEQWAFPSRSLAPGAFILVRASGKDRTPSSGELHSNWKLSPDGEFLGLYNAESPPVLVSSFAPRYPRQRVDHSYGLDASGALRWFATPTPGAPNEGGTSYEGFVLDVRATPGRGFYDEAQTVTLSSGTAGTRIRYTLDGSEPTPSRGTLYSGPIEISGTSARAVITLRALAHSSDGSPLLPSKVVTHSYVFPSNVVRQPDNPAGFPASWNGQTADYEMDQRVVNDPGHRDLVPEGLTSIPTLSIVTDNDSLFSANRGAYANASRSGISWERAVSAEFIYPEGVPSPGGGRDHQVDCGFRIQGGSSVNNWKVIKVSMRLLFKGDYGATKLRWRLFEDSRVDEFNTIVLDAHMNQTWQHPSHGQRVKGQYCRDQFVSDLQNAAGGYAPHDVFFNVYLNGLYWGVFDIHERADADFAASYLGGEPEEYDAIRHSSSRVVDGTSTAYNAMLSAARRDLSSTANYLNLQEHLDVPQLIDYMLVNFYAGNDDWAHHNWYASRLRAPGAGYLFHSWDAEHVLKDVNVNRTGVNNSGSPAEVYDRLRANADFRMQFADHAHRHFSPGGMFFVDPEDSAWDPDNPERNRPASFWMRRISEINSAIASEAARWGDTRRPADPYTRNDEWLAELNNLLRNYFPRRSGIVLGQLRSANLYPTVSAPSLSVTPGEVAPGTQVRLLGGGTVHFTLDGSDPRRSGGAVSPTASVYEDPFAIADYTHVKARRRSGSTWSALAEGIYTLAPAAGSIRLSEIAYNPPGGNLYEFVELENFGERTVGLTGSAFVEGIQFVFDRETVLAPGEHLVLVADPASFSSRYPGVDVAGSFLGRLDNGGDRLRLLDRDGSTILDASYEDSSGWPRGPDGFGFTLVPAIAGLPETPEDWRASRDVGGSPGTPDPLRSRPDVVLNEILAHSGPGAEDRIELLNRGSSSIDLAHWFVSDANASELALRRHALPEGTVLGAGEFLVLTEAELGFEFSADGGEVHLAEADSAGEFLGHMIHRSYRAEEVGITLGRHPTSEGEDFTALSEASFGEGAGAENSAPLVGPIVIHEIHYHPDAGAEEFVELRNLGSEAISLYDEELALGWQLEGLRSPDGSQNFAFGPGDTIPGGGLLLVVSLDPAVFRQLHAVPAGVPIVGAYGGSLDNSGESLRLERPLPAIDPSDLDGAVYQSVDRVRFNDALPWPVLADGAGPSLERIRADAYGNDPVHWAASIPRGGTPGLSNSTAVGDGPLAPVAILRANPSSGEAPLDVLFDASGSYDLDGEIVAYRWTVAGESASGRSLAWRFDEPGGYAVVLEVEDDEGLVGTAETSVVVAADQGGGQVPADMNQDLQVDISDAIGLLQALFLGASFPCDAEGSRILMDSNGDASSDLSDAVHLLSWLFLAGDAPALGTECVLIPGCPDACAP